MEPSGRILQMEIYRIFIKSLFICKILWYTDEDCKATERLIPNGII